MSDSAAADVAHAVPGHHEELGFWRTYVFSTDHKGARLARDRGARL